LLPIKKKRTAICFSFMSAASQKYPVVIAAEDTDLATWWLSVGGILLIAWILYGFLQYLSYKIGWSSAAAATVAKNQQRGTAPPWTVASQLGVTQLLKDLPRLYLKTGQDLWRGPFRGSQLLYQTSEKR
jgi:hypothetical protein